MNYNIKELIEKLEAKVVKLGINPKFRDNPAFASALLQIKSLMHKGSTNESNKEVLKVKIKFLLVGKINMEINIFSIFLALHQKHLNALA